MAGPSSEAGHLNIGTAGSSSHPEIEPEIEAVQAIEDSDEVCGLERKECDNIMEHLKTNPGLVVKSLGPEGRIVLHVAVMAGETKEPKPPASKCTDKGFSEAAVDSDWYRALEWRDCKALMALLKENPCLVAQTGPEGLTVLHAAARRGCLQLLLQVSDLFEDEDQFVDEMSGLKVAWADLRGAKCGTFEAEAQHMAWFSCPVGVWRTLRLGGQIGWTEGFRCVVSQDLTDKLIEIMQREPSKKAFKNLEWKYQLHTDYNFLFEPGWERKELQFHYACGKMYYDDDAEEYVKTIIDGCLELEPSQSVEVLTYLFQLQNAQGKPPFHLTLWGGTAELLKLVPPGVDYKKCLNARDERGWTTLHCAAATRNHEALEALLKDERIEVNARTHTLDALFYGQRVIENTRRSTDDCITYKDERVDPSTMMQGKTALHLAILHNDARSVELLLTKYCDTDVNAPLYRYIVCGYERIRPGEDFEKKRKIQDKRSIWLPLQLAAIMGLSDVVRVLLTLKLDDIYDDGKLQNNTIVREDFRGVSALLLASASGNPDTLRLFVDNPKFNSLVKSREGATALHYGTNAMIPFLDRKFFSRDHQKIGPCVWFTDSGEFDSNTSIYEEPVSEDRKLIPTSYLGRQACITILLQAGVDIWERDNDKRFAELGPEASEEGLLWWYQKIAQETLEAKKSLNDAANAISVVAALVATASFVGPLQPPLGYGEDSVEGGV